MLVKSPLGRTRQSIIIAHARPDRAQHKPERRTSRQSVADPLSRSPWQLQHTCAQRKERWVLAPVCLCKMSFSRLTLGPLRPRATHRARRGPKAGKRNVGCAGAILSSPSRKTRRLTGRTLKLRGRKQRRPAAQAVGRAAGARTQRCGCGSCSRAAAAASYVSRRLR